MLIKSGDVDIARDPLQSEYSALKNNPNINVTSKETLRTYFLYVNGGKAPFNDTRVRQALSYAINRQEIVDTALEGVSGIPATGVFTNTMGKEYIQTARGKGLSEKIVVVRHALKNALVPVITVVGLSTGFLLNGSVVVETIFGWSGIGNLVVDSILSHDYMMVQGSVLFVAVIFLLVNFFVDLVYVWANPEIRYDRTS